MPVILAHSIIANRPIILAQMSIKQNTILTRAHWDSLPGRNLSDVCAIHAQHPTHSVCSAQTPAVLAIATSRSHALYNDVTTLLSLRIMTS